MIQLCVVQLQMACHTWEALQEWPSSPPCPPLIPLMKGTSGSSLLELELVLDLEPGTLEHC